MFQDSWSLYEVRRPRKWMFHPPKRRPYVMPLFGGMALVTFVLAMLRF